MGKLIISAAVAIAVVLGCARLGVTQGLGAHPFWAFDVALYGALPGVLLALCLMWLTRWALWFAMLDFSLSLGVAIHGKARFVASSGDDAFGGQLWFYGWIAACACAVAVLMIGLHRFVGKTAD